MVVVFSRRNPVLARGRPSVYVEYQDPSTTLRRVRSYPPDSFGWSDGRDASVLRVGPSSVALRGPSVEELTYVVELDLPEIRTSLTVRPRHRGFLPSPDGCTFRNRSDSTLSTSVSFSAPIADVEGEVVVRGRRVPVKGQGYHDHPWGTEMLFWTHRRWTWGRATTPEAGVLFAHVRPAADYEGTLRFLFRGARHEFEPTIDGDLVVEETEWKRSSWHGLRFPHRLQVTAGGRAWEAVYTDDLLDTPFYDRAAVSWTPRGGIAGTGWTEYYDLPGWARGLVFAGARIVTFFLRPFPWFGR